MKPKKLFNPQGNDCLDNRRIIKGDTTNLIQLNNIKYKWATNLYQRLVSNFWLPEKVDLSPDISDYSRLSSHEKHSYKGILSFLVFLDSLQVNNLPHISDFITAPEINLALSVHTFQEAIHSQSYQVLIEAVLPIEERESIYTYWKDNEILLERNKYIANIFQEFLDNKSETNFFKVLVANYILESVYFVNGFIFFYSLTARHLMSGTADMISLIHRDENVHFILFQNILIEYIKENNIKDAEYIIKSMFYLAVEEEIKWSNHIIGEEILGINFNSSDVHTKYLANQRIQALGYSVLYTEEKYKINPYLHLNKIGNAEGKGEVKSNFFESTVTNYTQSSAVSGWDEF